MTLPIEALDDRSEYWKDYYQNHKPEVKQKVRQWRDNNRERTRAQVRKGELKRKYNITPEEYNAMLEAQRGVCDICHETCSSGRRLAVDHCHTTGKARGLLCAKCNTVVGWLERDPRTLVPAMEYLKRYRKAPQQAEIPPKEGI